MYESILVLAAQPDDDVLGCGGTIARFSNQGADVFIVFLAGGVSSRQQKKLVSKIELESFARRESAQIAANILGASSVTFGDFPDNRKDSVDLLDIVQFVEFQVNHFASELILAHHASDLDIDHCLVYQAAVTACRLQPAFFVQTLLFFEVVSGSHWQLPQSASIFGPNWFIDITPYLKTRIRALEIYAEEMRPWPHNRSYNAVEYLARWRGASVGVEVAEAFMRANYNG